MVELCHDGEVTGLESLDHMHLPQGTVEIERTTGQFAHESGELVRTSGCGHARPAHMELEVEIRVFDPHGVMEAEGDTHGTSPKWWNQVEPFSDDPPDALVGSFDVVSCPSRRFEDHDRQHVQLHRGCLHGQETGIETGETFHRAIGRRAVRCLPARMPEAAQPPAALGELALIRLGELRFLDRLDDELSDAVTSLDLVGNRRVGVDQQDTKLVTVSGVDQAGSVEARDAVAQRQAAAGEDEARVSRRQRHGDPRGHEPPVTAGGEHDVFAGVEVRPGVSPVCVRRDGQVGVEPDERHLEHGCVP